MPLKPVPDPLDFQAEYWPRVQFYKEQVAIIRSVVENDFTVVPAGNKLGKDFVTAFIILYTFLTRTPCRIVTTSAKDDHLRVLWGEIKHFIDMCEYPLDAKQGGPLIINHQEIKRFRRDSRDLDPISYIIGMVASDDTIAAMGGHHANPDTLEEANDGVPRTLFVTDESSSVPTVYLETARPWARRILSIGNTWPCDNFFKWAVEGRPGTTDRGGDMPRADGDPRPGLYRKVIHIPAVVSPNVRYGMWQAGQGLKPTNEVIVPGVKTYAEYVQDLADPDERWKTITLEARFYKGKGSMLFPEEWLTRAERIAASLDMNGKRRRKAKAIGIDPAEGGDKTTMCGGDELGVIKLTGKKTPDTDCIPREALAFAYEMGWREKDEFSKMYFDRGGGGKQAADRLRAMGYPVRSIGFGESISMDPKRGMTFHRERVETKESRFAYKNRRAQMYGQLREVLDPTGGLQGIGGPKGFALPREYAELRRQLAPIPLDYHDEGSLKLPPKNKPAGSNSKVVSLSEMLGGSPDESDSLVLMLFSLLSDDDRPEAGAI